MAAELRVDTIKGRAGINTFTFKGDGFFFDQKVGIGTTVASDPVLSTNAGKLSVGVASCYTLYVSGTSHAKIPSGTTAQRPGTAVDGDIRYNSTLSSYEGYGNSAWGGLGGGTEVDVSVSSTSATNLTTFLKASYRSASIRIQIVQGSAYQVGRYLMIHDGTTATIVEKFAMATGSMLGTFTVTISGDNMLLQVNMGSSSSATVTVKSSTLTV